MKKCRNASIFMFYGEGGHKAEMEALLSHMLALRNNIDYIGFVEGEKVINNIKNCQLIPMRSKYNKLFLLFLIPCAFFYNTLIFLLMMIKYRPKGIISTGPGSVLFPAILCRILQKKVIYIENGCRFNTKSMTAKYMYFIANRFYVQHKDLLTLYPKAIYAGLL